MICRARRRQLLLASSTLALACALVFAPDAYLPMLARSFMVWWSLALLLLALFAIWRRLWWLCMVSVVKAPILFMQVSVPGAVITTDHLAPGLRVAHMNVFQRNTERESAIKAALATDPDLISVQEVDHEWARALRTGFAATHPYQYLLPRTDCYGIALFSRIPFEQIGTIEIAGAQFIEARVKHDGSLVRVLAVHASSPIDYTRFRQRNAQLDELADRLRKEDLPTLVIGDLNTVHWDNAYQRFCSRSGARPINTPFNITWPSVGPLALIPIDHALVAGQLRPTSLASFKVRGSDHRGLITEVQLAHAH